MKINRGFVEKAAEIILKTDDYQKINKYFNCHGEHAAWSEASAEVEMNSAVFCVVV